uniref:Peroxiredoxin C-terminal domain-containing protein n=1 Tax=Glossina palpalis gambiensis TaxID=67801 RepID=A0A1B0BYX4_9MUSC
MNEINEFCILCAFFGIYSQSDWLEVKPYNQGSEILRNIDSMELTGRNSLATPANWNQGNICIDLFFPTKKLRKSILTASRHLMYLREIRISANRRSPNGSQVLNLNNFH